VQYWVVLLLGDHRPHDNHHDICGAAIVSRQWQGEWEGGRVHAIHHHQTVEILRGIVLCIFRIKINTLLCYTVVSVLVSLEANIIGYRVPCLASF